MSLVLSWLPRRPLVRGALLSQAAGIGTAAVVAALVAAQIQAGGAYLARTIVVDTIVAAIVLCTITTRHEFDRVGAANVVTTIRAALVAATAGLIGEPSTGAVAAAAATLAVLITMLDGVDGWLARRTGMPSAFGARFDMEVDALLILVLAVVAWMLGKAGVWIVLAGALRYLFVAAGWFWHWIAAPLPPSTRRKVICVVQIVGLAAIVSPVLTVPASAVVALATLGMLTWSFAVDTWWLRRNRA